MLLVKGGFAHYDPDVILPHDCGNKAIGGGYEYPAPSVQLTTSGIKYASAPSISYASAPSYSYAAAPAISYGAPAISGYAKSNLHTSSLSSGYKYQSAAPVLSKLTVAQPLLAVSQPTYIKPAITISSAPAHGYSTSAGLSSFNSGYKSDGYSSGGYSSGGYSSGGYSSGGYSSGGYSSGGYNSGGYNSGGFGSSGYSYAQSPAKYISSSNLAYAQTPIIGKVSAAPVIAKYVAPIIQKQYSAPLIQKTYAAPAIPKYAAPLIQSYSSAPAYKTIASPSYISSPSYTSSSSYISSPSYVSAPAIKTVAAPAYISAPAYKTVAAPAYQNYVSAAPALKIATPVYSQPAYTSYAQPALIKQYAAPAPTLIKQYAAPAPIIKSYASAAPAYVKSVVSTPIAKAPLTIVKNVHTKQLDYYVRKNSIFIYKKKILRYVIAKPSRSIETSSQFKVNALLLRYYIGERCTL